MGRRLLTLFLSASVLLCGTAIGQTLPPILAAEKPTRGIYLSFQEFLNNSPSIGSDFELKGRSKAKQYLVGGSDYSLEINNPIPGHDPKKYWGVSTGDSIYVNVSNYQANRGYIKLEKLGRYCYVKGKVTRNAYVYPLGGAVGGAVSAIPVDAAVILNINNGKFYLLDETLMTRILQGDPELSDNYARERREEDPDIMLGYIDKYNARHPEEIGRKGKLATIIFYRNEKKERPDSISAMVINGSDTIKVRLGAGHYQRLTADDRVVTICALGDCKNFNLRFEEINYFEYMFKEKDKQPRLLHQEKKVGEFYVKEIEAIRATNK